MNLKQHPAGFQWTQIGDCRLVLGDCLDVMRVMKADSIDMIWTDPPYGHNNADGDLMAARAELLVGGKTAERMNHKPIANDGQDDMRRVVSGMLTEAVRVMRVRSSVCCCCCCGGGGPRPTFAWVANRMDTDGLSFFHSVIWDKKCPGLGWKYRRRHEMVMIAHLAKGKLAWADNDVAIPNIVAYFPPKDRQHPNEKPLLMVSDFIKWHSTIGQTVLDPFMGSGTTGEACVRTGRKFIGIELDEGHFQTAYNRIKKAHDDVQNGLVGLMLTKRQPEASFGIKKKKKSRV